MLCQRTSILSEFVHKSEHCKNKLSRLVDVVIFIIVKECLSILQASTWFPESVILREFGQFRSTYSFLSILTTNDLGLALYCLHDSSLTHLRSHNHLKLNDSVITSSFLSMRDTSYLIKKITRR